MKLKLCAKNILPLLASKFGMKFTKEQLESNEDVIRKGVTMVPGADEEGVALIKASTTDCDYDNEVVLPEGIDTTQFMENAPVCWSHDYNIPAIGKGLAVSIQDDEFYIKTKFANGLTVFATEIWNLVKGGFVKGASMGFFPLQKVLKGATGFEEMVQKRLSHLSKDAKARVESIVTKSMLVELSICNMGKNPQALVMAVSQKSITLSPETMKALGMGQVGDVVVTAEKGTSPVKKSFTETKDEMEAMGVTVDKVEAPKPIEHTDETSDDEPDWSYLSSWSLPKEAYAFVGHPDRPHTWRFAHHYMSSGGKMLCHKVGLVSACSNASYEVHKEGLMHIKAHIDALAKKEASVLADSTDGAPVPTDTIYDKSVKAVPTIPPAPAPIPAKTAEEINAELRKGVTILASSREIYDAMQIRKSIGRVMEV